MNFSKIINFIFSPVIIAASGTNSINPKEESAIENIINQHRASKPGDLRIPAPINSRYVVYNHEISTLMANWSRTLYGRFSSYGIVNLDACWRANSPNNVGSYLCHDIVYSAAFENEIDWTYGFYGQANNGKNAISSALKYVNRAFNYASCSTNVSSFEHSSCQDTSLKQKKFYKDPLNFVPMLLSSGLSEVACLLTGKPAPWLKSSESKKNSFFCLFKIVEQNTDNGDQPYLASKKGVPPCSACPSDVVNCKKNLCIA